MKASLENWLTNKWYQPNFSLQLLPLLPFSWLFYLLQAARKFAYQKKFFQSFESDIPVIVVGNITLGGTGKTSFVIWLAMWLKRKGYRPGIILRGVGAKQNTTPFFVKENDTAMTVSDEGLLLARKTQSPVVICKDRAKAADFLAKNTDCNIIISDDGLQHYRLTRQMEIILVDAERKFGNQKMLPAGPLREPLSRLASVDLVIEKDNCHGSESLHPVNNEDHTNENHIRYRPLSFVNIKNPSLVKPLDYFKNQEMNIVLSIGHPQQFLNLINKIQIKPHAKIFSDHHQYTQYDFHFNNAHPILMTAKDATKACHFVTDNAWYLEIELEVALALQTQLEKLFLQFPVTQTEKGTYYA